MLNIIYLFDFANYGVTINISLLSFGEKMKKDVRSQRQKLSFNIFRAIAICAVVCTIGLAIFLWAEALTPGDKSAEQSTNVADTIRDHVDVIENEQVPLTALNYMRTGTAAYYIGETENLRKDVIFIPTDATDKRLTYTSSDPEKLTVDKNGNITIVGGYGDVYITIASVENPEIKVRSHVFIGGKKPVEGETTDFSMYKIKSDKITPIETSITVCEEIFPLYKDQNDEIIGANSVSLKSSDTSVVAIRGKFLYGISEGTATITATCKSAGLTKEFEVVVTNPNNLSAPTSFEFKEDVMNLSIFSMCDIFTNLVHPKYGFMCKLKIGDKNIIRRINDNLVPNAIGQTTITMTPYANPDESFTYTINVYEPIPESMRISGEMRILSGEKHKYTISYNDGKQSGTLKMIKWEVVGDNATITQNGVLVANKLGNVTIRATSLQNPEVYAEVTIRVSLFESFGLFVRKVLGHFSAFAVLGLGFAVSYFLLMRPRWTYAPCALVSGFLVATMSEVFQLPIFTPDRGPSWVDVMIDTMGVATGIAIASLIIFAYLIFIKVSKKQSLKVRRTLDSLKPKTLFLSPAKTAILMDMQEYKLDNDCSTQDATPNCEQPSQIDQTAQS